MYLCINRNSRLEDKITLWLKFSTLYGHLKPKNLFVVIDPFLSKEGLGFTLYLISSHHSPKPNAFQEFSDVIIKIIDKEPINVKQTWPWRQILLCQQQANEIIAKQKVCFLPYSSIFTNTYLKQFVIVKNNVTKFFVFALFKH